MKAHATASKTTHILKPEAVILHEKTLHSPNRPKLANTRCENTSVNIPLRKTHPRTNTTPCVTNTSSNEIHPAPTPTKTIIPSTTLTQSTKLKIRTEKSAKVLVFIVILFLATHIYRLALNIYEVSFPNAQTMETFKICFALKR